MLSFAELDELAQRGLARSRSRAAFCTAIAELRRELGREQIVVSDRRWRNSLDVLRAHAFLSGRAIVTEDDLGFLEHVLWKDPEEHPKVRDAIHRLVKGYEEQARELLIQSQELREYAERGWESDELRSRAIVESPYQDRQHPGPLRPPGARGRRERAHGARRGDDALAGQGNPAIDAAPDLAGASESARRRCQPRKPRPQSCFAPATTSNPIASSLCSPSRPANFGGIAKGAKASRRRFEHRLEPFSHVMLYFRRRPHGQLVFITRAEAAGLQPFRLEDNLGRLALGTYMLELAEALTPKTRKHRAPTICWPRRSALSARERPTRRCVRLTAKDVSMGGLRYAVRPLSHLRRNQIGSAPVYFIIGRGGVVCARCRVSAAEGGIRLGAASAAALVQLGELPLADASAATAAGADGALAIARFVASVVDRKLRSVEFLDSVIAPARQA